MEKVLFKKLTVRGISVSGKMIKGMDLVTKFIQMVKVTMVDGKKIKDTVLVLKCIICLLLALVLL